MPPSDYVLAVETSGLGGSVALARGHRLIAERSLSGDRRHSAELFPAMSELCALHGCRLTDLGVFCFSQGPGSFTGLRIAATMARVLSLTSACRVLGVPTLEVIARRALSLPDPPPRTVAVLSAKGAQVYAAAFQLDAARELAPLVPLTLTTLSDLPRLVPPPFALTGPGLDRRAAPSEIGGVSVLPADLWPPRAVEVIAVAQPSIDAGRSLARADMLPLYMRPPECEEVYDQRRAEARRRATQRETG